MSTSEGKEGEMKYLLTEFADDGSFMTTITIEAPNAESALRHYHTWCVETGIKPAPSLEVTLAKKSA